MRHTGNDRHGWRLRATIVVLRRAGLRVQEPLALAEPDPRPVLRLRPTPVPDRKAQRELVAEGSAVSS
jgi:hypothetical protein